MHAIQPSELVKHLSFADHPFPMFRHHRKVAGPIQALTLQANQPVARLWLPERGPSKTVLTINQPRFNSMNRGGDHE